jgi:hypothetical protein
MVAGREPDDVPSLAGLVVVERHIVERDFGHVDS